MDELSASGPTRVSETTGGTLRTYELRPEDFGLARPAAPAPRVRDAAESASLIREVLAGASGPARDLVLVNAAAVLVVAEIADGWRTGLERAAASIALAGESKRTKKPSPAVSTSVPLQRDTSRRTTSLCCSSSARQATSPSRCA